MALVVAVGLLGSGWPARVGRALDVLGLALVVVGVVLGAWSARSLGPAFTPLPEPASGGSLVESGPYRRVRHPVYAAGLLVFGGLALVLSPLALVPAGALAVVWALKAVVE